MSGNNHFFKAVKAGYGLGVVFLLTLTGCVAYVDRPPQGSVYVAPPVVVVEDDYVYYPDYEIYYSSSRHQYAYREGSVWVSRPAPRGVSIDVLRGSRSVRMDFHDSPEHHHADVVRQYPGNRAQPGSSQGRNNNQKGNQRDDRGGNNGR